MNICKSSRKCLACDFLIIFNLFIMFQIYDTRPPLRDDRIVFMNKAHITASRRKTDCGNIVRLIDNQNDLFKCLLDAYNSDVHEIVFPDSDENLAEETLLPLISPLRKAPLCARNRQTFCENIDTYPRAKIQSFLEKNNTLNAMFGVDEATDEFINRDGVENEKFMCDSEQRLIFPKVGKTKDKQWKYIVNQGNSPSEGYIQGVLIRSCKSQDEPCQFADNLPYGVIATCKQMYVYRKLLSLKTEGITVNEYFEFPSACCCSYKQSYGYPFKRNANISPAKKKQTS